MTDHEGHAGDTGHTEHHRHAESAPRSNPWKAVAIVLASLIVVGLIAWLVFWLVGGGTGPAPTPTPTETSSTPTPTPTPTPTAAAVCTTDTATAELGEPNGAAGSVTMPIIFTNTSNAPCTLEGFPVVEFVGDGNGTTIGAPATDNDETAVALVTIEPGNSAMALLTVTEADVEGCTRVPVDGFRVTPPGSNDAFFIANTDYQGCQEDVSVLSVSAIATN
jgi:hypothetical protein